MTKLESCKEKDIIQYKEKEKQFTTNSKKRENEDLGDKWKRQEERCCAI